MILQANHKVQVSLLIKIDTRDVMPTSYKGKRHITCYISYTKAVIEVREKLLKHTPTSYNNIARNVKMS